MDSSGHWPLSARPLAATVLSTPRGHRALGAFLQMEIERHSERVTAL